MKRIKLILNIILMYYLKNFESNMEKNILIFIKILWMHILIMKQVAHVQKKNILMNLGF